MLTTSDRRSTNVSCPKHGEKRAGMKWECLSLCAALPLNKIRLFYFSVYLLLETGQTRVLVPRLGKVPLSCKMTDCQLCMLAVLGETSCLKDVKTLGSTGIKACERKASKNSFFQSVNKVCGLSLGFWHPPSSCLREASREPHSSVAGSLCAGTELPSDSQPMLSSWNIKQPVEICIWQLKSNLRYKNWVWGWDVVSRTFAFYARSPEFQHWLTELVLES